MDTTQETTTKPPTRRKRIRPYKPKPPKPTRQTKERFNPTGYAEMVPEYLPPPPPAPRKGGPVITFDALPDALRAPEDPCPNRAAFIDSIVARRRFNDTWMVAKDWGTDKWFVVNEGKWMVQDYPDAQAAIAAAERLMEAKK